MSNKAADAVSQGAEQARGLVPKLRFTEFRDAGDWEEKPLKRLLTIGNGRDYKHLSRGSIPVYGSGGYMLSVDDYVYDGESVCIGRKGTIDNPMFLSGKFWTVDTLFYTHNFRDCLPKFIFSIFQNITWKKHSEAGGVPSLSKTNIEKIEVAVPRIKEQQKIADCLSSLDAVIAAEGDRLAALKDHKKGLMQQLFPAKDQTTARFRFPEFEGAGAWAVKPFSKLFKVGNGRDYKHLDEGDIPVYGSGGYMRTVSDYLYDGDSACIGRKGTIDKPIFLTGKFWTVDTLFYTHSFEDCLPRFIFAIFQQIDWAKHNEAGGVPSLSKTNIEKIEVAVPTIEEQAEIVKCVISIDSLIVAQGNKLDALKTHKKALIQQLFPSPAQATA